MKQIPLSAQLVMGIYIILITAHISALVGIDPTLGNFQEMFLLLGFFFALMPFWIMLIFKANKHMNFSNQTFIFKQIKKNVPSWMMKMTYVAIAYGIVSFAFTFVSFANPSPNKIKDNIFHFRAFSAHLSIFYVLTISGLTGLANFIPKKCSNGHELRVEAKHCPDCGVEVNQ